MTKPTGGEWKQLATMIYSKEGNICILSDPEADKVIGYTPLEISSPSWDEAIANGQLIIEAVAAYRYLLEKYGPEWKERI